MPPSRRRSSLAVFALTVALTVTPLTANALDLPSWLQKADTASTATVFLVPPMALFRDALDEGRMQDASCRYVTADPAAVRALVGLLKAADIADSPVYQRPDMREGVYLALDDGTRLKFLMQDNRGGRSPVGGIVEGTAGGDIRSNGVTARSTLSADLRAWAARQGGPGAGAACARQTPLSAAP